jgi:hypothetical protein
MLVLGLRQQLNGFDELLQRVSVVDTVGVEALAGFL